MTQPTTLGGRPLTPAPGAPTPELRVARLRPRATRLFWSAVVLIAVAGAVGYFYDNLREPFADWMLLSAAGAVVLLLVVLPFVSWWAQRYTITTRRVIARSGPFGRRRAELSHVRGYTVQLKRGILQRIGGGGTLVLSNGVDAPVRLRRIANVALVYEVLVDQVEVNQILAHRDSQSLTPPPLPS
ncbi:PH domain-containing protein [Microbacterium hatanonis]|uniref:PH domain-containing protein n=1 Tax=Microbacterium hatanonis TaxID=404366 RepID=A0A5C8I6X4_9MICO|nr:PH domain-containing protein [Microbacterium hatanonis]TXK13625.1 PH domain-containing protein [Microbacterium hatanonis]